ncbi:MAG: AraC family transcriptional regulator [Proteobacteria bacterium]|nr:AraC family transcriptional regulator [Pseudomonadota bacterium]MBU1583613.1 AraC family transcriptional regulator [Pseudomonadota bacterium]MBU2455735.1 AraC family transcriptional regulator [Pseudomonadota bacterium]MBU2628431.1 AraC family transcriptional regulator [Pseudomonadota bacterium]
MRDTLTIDTAPVLGHFCILADHGIPVEALETAVGMTRDMLEKKDARVPFLSNIKLIETGIQVLGPATPLMLGSRISLEKLGACGHIFKHCENLEEVLHQFLRYQKLLYAVSGFSITQTPHSVIIVHAVKIPLFKGYNRILVELAFSSIITAMQALTGKQVIAREIRFAHEKPGHVKAYQDIFRAPLRFDQENDMMVLDKIQLTVSIPSSHAYIKDTLTQHADGLLITVASGSRLTDRVKDLVRENLHKGHVDIEMISEKLNMSRWTLTRKLKKEGITFKHLMDSLKMELARHYLVHTPLSITDIAFLLGYSETSVFSRAFKNWTRENPSQFKQKLFQVMPGQVTGS